MPKKHGMAGLTKTTNSHSSYTDFAAEGVVLLNGLLSVVKIAPSIISAQSGRRSGHRSLRVNRVSHGGLALKFSSAGTQTIYVSATDQESVIESLRKWSEGKGNCVFRTLG